MSSISFNPNAGGDNDVFPKPVRILDGEKNSLPIELVKSGVNTESLKQKLKSGTMDSLRDARREITNLPGFVGLNSEIGKAISKELDEQRSRHTVSPNFYPVKSDADFEPVFLPNKIGDFTPLNGG